MKFSPLFALSALIVVAPAAFAQSTTDITVIGTITPMACTPTLSGGGEFNFGKISAQDLDQETATQFKSPARQLSVVCNAPSRIALRAIDGRAGSQPTVTIDNFGLGLNGVERIGEYQLVTANYTADGNASVDVLESRDGGASWIKVP